MATSTVARRKSPLDNILSKAKSYGLATKEDPDHLTEKGEFFGRLSLLLQIKSQLSTQQQLLEAAKHLLPASAASDTRATTQTNVLQSLEQMSTDLESFLEHMDHVIGKKEMITQYLQTPFSSDYLVIESEHQAHFLELYQTISAFLLHLPTTLATMEWASKFSLTGSQLERKLWSLSAFLAKCQRYGDALNHSNSLVKELM